MDRVKQATLAADPWAIGWTIRTLVLVTFLSALAVPFGFIPIISLAEEGEAQVPDGPISIIIPLSTPEPTPTPQPEIPPTPTVPRIGIIAGHYGSDSGAVCPDGLQEVEITIGIATRVVAMLQQYGWEVDLLEEFDSRLHGYVADALVSIHADSCDFPEKTGYKVARVESSYIPELEDRLVDCLIDEYARFTSLQFDAHTITYDMTHYHAFYEINPSTPGAIIETGFMARDRELLTQGQDIVARGIVEGVLCFVEGIRR